MEEIDSPKDDTSVPEGAAGTRAVTGAGAEATGAEATGREATGREIVCVDCCVDLGSGFSVVTKFCAGGDSGLVCSAIGGLSSC